MVCFEGLSSPVLGGISGRINGEGPAVCRAEPSVTPSLFKATEQHMNSTHNPRQTAIGGVE